MDRKKELELLRIAYKELKHEWFKKAKCEWTINKLERTINGCYVFFSPIKTVKAYEIVLKFRNGTLEDSQDKNKYDNVYYLSDYKKAA